MEAVNGAIVYSPDPEGAAAEAARGPATIGPERTAGAYTVMMGVVPADDDGPPLHRHPFTDELFYIAEGEMTFTFGDREVVVGAGSSVFVPRGAIHTARVSGGAPMRGMLLISPGDAEHVIEPVEGTGR